MPSRSAFDPKRTSFLSSNDFNSLGVSWEWNAIKADLWGSKRSRLPLAKRGEHRCGESPFVQQALRDLAALSGGGLDAPTHLVFRRCGWGC